MPTKINLRVAEGRFVRRLTTLSGGFLAGQLLILRELADPNQDLHARRVRRVRRVHRPHRHIRQCPVVALRDGGADRQERSRRGRADGLGGARGGRILRAHRTSEHGSAPTGLPPRPKCLSCPDLLVDRAANDRAVEHGPRRSATGRSTVARLAQCHRTAGPVCRAVRAAGGFRPARICRRRHGDGLRCLGYVVRFAFMAGVVLSRRSLAACIRPAAVRAIHGNARRNWQYPAFSAPSALLEASTQLMLPLCLAMLFGPTMAGLFALGQRLMGLPIRLFAQAARQVFLGEAAEREPAGIYRLVQEVEPAVLRPRR